MIRELKPFSLNKKIINFFYFPFVILFLLIPLFSLKAQLSFEKGNITPILNFSPKTYRGDAQNWSIVQDDRGIMYFGNNSCILEFDGITWRKIFITNESTVWSMDIDSSGRIFVGGINEFGFLAADEYGTLGYRSLIDFLKPESRDFGEVWNTHVTSEGIYFQTSYNLFRWDGEKIKSWAHDNFCPTSFYVNGNLFIWEENSGLKIMRNDSLILLPSGNRFADFDIRGIVPVADNEILIFTKLNGAFRIQMNTDLNESLIVKRFTTIDNFITGNEINTVIKLSNHKYSIGTWGNGLIIYNQLNDQFEFVNKQTGLQDNIIQNQFEDNTGNLWLSLSRGISMIPIGSPVTAFKDNTGLESTIESITRFNNEIFVASHLGCFHLIPAKNSTLLSTKYSKVTSFQPYFEPINGLQTESWNLCNYENTDENLLLVALTYKISQIDEKNRVQTITENYPYFIHQSKKHASMVFIGLENGIETIRRKNGNWIIEGRINGIDELINDISEDSFGNIWMATNNGIVYKLQQADDAGKFFGEISRFDSLNGIPVGATRIELKDGIPLLGTHLGIFRYSETRNEFIPDSTFPEEFINGSTYIHRMSIDPHGLIWLVTIPANTEEFETGFLEKQKDNSYLWVNEPFLNFNGAAIHSIYHEDKGITWLAGTDGVFKYDNSIVKNFKLDFNTLIRKVSIGGDSIIFNGTFSDENQIPSIEQAPSTKPEFPFSERSIMFEFSSPLNDDDSPQLYSYYLEGYDKEWSYWNTSHRKEYTNLHEKNYIFHVKAKNLYGHVGQTANFQFTVMPPWYRTVIAYFSYLIIATFFIWGIIILYTKNLRTIIKERTSEIQAQKNEIEIKNKDILDSIQYASKIQEALLPPNDFINELFPERFIFYLPRDIVSGDFYWMAKSDSKIITVTADCTGHGVPGAMMSMLGISFLKEISTQSINQNASDILNQLRSKVIESLHQFDMRSETRDGMDIALCIIDIANLKLQYAGANNSLYICRNNQLIITKADKMPISISSKVNKLFTNNIVDIRKGDLIYTFSDGYVDQFGGPKNRKFMIKNFRDLLLEIHNLEMSEQKIQLEKTLFEWMGDNEQIDDILVMGIKI